MQARIAYAFQQIAPAKVTIAHALVPQHVARLTQPIERGQYRRYREVRLRTVAGVQPIVGIRGETWWTWCKPTFPVAHYRNVRMVARQRV